MKTQTQIKGGELLIPELVEAETKNAIVPLSRVQDFSAESVMVRLNKLGLKGVANKIGKIKQMKTAYGTYLYIDQEKITGFNKRLREDTLWEDKNARNFKQLVFIRLEVYEEIPPAHVLDALEKATELGCFDYFEIAKIQWIKEIKDPIVFGRIEGCPDRFFISQWDDDVKIDDLLFFNK